MTTTFGLVLRVFPVKIMDTRTGEESTDTIVLDKTRLQAAQLIGQSSKELIERLYNREGFKVLSIGKPERQTLTLKLNNVLQLVNEVPPDAILTWKE